MTEERRGNIYIGSEKGRTKTHRAREVRDRASPDRSRETDETSGMGLTQEERRSKDVGSGMSVFVGNQLDARERTLEAFHHVLSKNIEIKHTLFLQKQVLKTF